MGNSARLRNPMIMGLMWANKAGCPRKIGRNRQSAPRMAKVAFTVCTVLCFLVNFIEPGLNRNLTMKRALIVEDDPAFERLLSRSIATLDGNWASHACQTGTEAMELLNAPDTRFDLGLP